MRKRTVRLRAAPAPAGAGYVDVHFSSGWAAGHVLASPPTSTRCGPVKLYSGTGPLFLGMFFRLRFSRLSLPSFAEPSAQSWRTVRSFLPIALFWDSGPPPGPGSSRPNSPSRHACPLARRCCGCSYPSQQRVAGRGSRPVPPPTRGGRCPQHRALAGPVSGGRSQWLSPAAGGASGLPLFPTFRLVRGKICPR